MSVAGISVSLFCLSLSAFLYKLSRPSDSSAGRIPSSAYLLHNQVTHARFLPVVSKHAFTYPTLSLLVSVDALECHKLDLGKGWIFGYGGLWGRIVGIRPEPYLIKQPGSIRVKLESVLRTRGYSQTMQDCWMMTMPSFLGFEGINPLTVYFCYDLRGCLWVSVLEVHNTFGESHIYVLEVGRNEDRTPSHGYDYQWTFPREFHVSPFNDRSGFYRISIKCPPHGPTQPSEGCTPPRPSVRVHLYTASEDNSAEIGQLKLAALLRPVSSTLLTSSTLLWALLRAPFALLLTMPRILYVAWILHYKKRLDVYLRPEPFPITSRTKRTPGGVKWLEEGSLDRHARCRVEDFLRLKAFETGIKITLIAGDPSVPHSIFSPDRLLPSAELIISYLSPRMFTILYLCPSAEHALLLGSDTEHVFEVSSKDIFIRVFSRKEEKTTYGWLQRLRTHRIPNEIALHVPFSHFLDKDTFLDFVVGGVIISTHYFLDKLEEWIFTITRARIVNGSEPWNQWNRASRVYSHTCP